MSGSFERHSPWAASSLDVRQTMPPPPRPLPSHSPSKSFSVANPHSTTASNRLSLTSPLSSFEDGGQRPLEVTSDMTPSPSQSRSTSPERRQSFAYETGNFLTDLAAQERKVLELREELQKAEAELDRLKKHWAQHEAMKKRNEIRRVEPLKSLASPRKGTVESDSEHERAKERREGKDEERRRAMYIHTKAPKRKVFESGRHTRTLSLLSPTVMENRGRPFSPLKVTAAPAKEESQATPLHIPMEEASEQDDDSLLGNVTLTMAQGNTKDDLVKTGKQFVGDLKDGLWTFFEDLRQATVGDEVNHSSRSRIEALTAQAKANSSPRSHGAGAVSTPDRSSPSVRRHPQRKDSLSVKLQHISADVIGTPRSEDPDPLMEVPTSTPDRKVSNAPATVEDDDWDNWDSPQTKTTSAASSDGPGTDVNSPRTSTSSFDVTPRPAHAERPSKAVFSPGLNVDQIPWPTLQKLSPSNLTRTASNLMSEWEKSLSDPDDTAKTTPKLDKEKTSTEVDWAHAVHDL